MQTTIENRDEGVSAMRVRQNAGPAAVGAAFLLYFGFFHLAEPTGTELFDRASWVFYHTLRIGGVAMAVVAVWSLLGQPITLAVDALITVAIGALLILTGIGMVVDGGGMIQTAINVVCGGMFISSGVRNWRDYRLLCATPASPASTIPIPSSSSSWGESRSEGVSRREQIVPRRETIEPSAPPPEGFLASLAKKRPPPNDDDDDEG